MIWAFSSRPEFTSTIFQLNALARRMITSQAISSSTTVMSICVTGPWPGGISMRMPGP